MTTVGGTGTAGAGNFDGQAPLNTPRGIGHGSAGYFYVADQLNHRIRRRPGGGWRPAGWKWRYMEAIRYGAAGVLGDGPWEWWREDWSMGLNSPSNVALGPSGFLIVDTGNHRLRRATIWPGVVETIAGTGEESPATEGGAALSALLNRPQGVAVDPAGNIYFSDTGHKSCPTDRSPYRSCYSIRAIQRVFIRFHTQSSRSGGAVLLVVTGCQVVEIDLETGTTMPVVGNGTCGSILDGSTGLLPVSIRRTSRWTILATSSSPRRTTTGCGASIARPGRLKPSRVTARTGPTERVMAARRPWRQCAISRGVSVELWGHVFIVEGTGGRVRRVDAQTRNISTVFLGSGVGCEPGDADAAAANGDPSCSVRTRPGS